MKQNKKYIAVTGGIGSGKTTVLNAAKEQGYPCFSADAIARGIYDDPSVLGAVRGAFPLCVKGDRVDRAALAAEVFSDAAKLAVLNEITHPPVMNKLWNDMRAAEGNVVFAEVPLLFEGGYEGQFDEVIVVLRPTEERISALAARDGMSRREALSRMQNQFDYEKNKISGHTLLYNDCDFDEFKRRAAAVVRAAAEADQK